MSFHFSRFERSTYERDGFLVRTSIFSEPELIALRAAVEDAASLARQLSIEGRTYWLDGKRFVDIGTMTVQFEHAPESETIRVIEPVHHLNANLDHLISDPRITEPMSSIIGCDRLSVWTNKLNLKRPREGSGFAWHQDSPYWIHDSGHVDKLPNVMVLLDDANVANGCFQVIRGSHRKGCLPGTNDGTQLAGFFTDPGSFDIADAVPMHVPAGSLVFFSPHAVHGSGPNTSDRARRALILTYQPADFPMLKTGQVRNI